MNILVYSDGKPDSENALRFAGHLHRTLNARLAVITVRSGTHAAEDPPPVGTAIPRDEPELSVGLKKLTGAAETLSALGVLPLPDEITIQDTPRGHIFVCKGHGKDRIAFYEVFGHFVSTLNQEVDDNGYDLLVIAPPLRSRLGRLVIGDTTRKLALDLHTSVLIVRGGDPKSRFLVCADGSPAAHRQFPLLRNLIPAIESPVDLIYVQTPEQEESEIREARTCLEHAGEWLSSCGKKGTFRVEEDRHRAASILAAAGNHTVIMLGASLRHDVYKRMLGSLPMQILDKTESSVLLVKLPPEAGIEDLKAPFECH